ncbi:MAG: bacillolysin [Chloroflexi bacterium]|nr:bacillolysin [Chloroflexota bacterium]
MTLLLAALVLVVFCAPMLGVAAPRRQLQPIGRGAQFLPWDAPLYLSLDVAEDQEQIHYLDRLTSFYVSSDDLDQALRQAGGGASPYASLDELRQAIMTWVGGEIFFALPRSRDLQNLAASGGLPADVDDSTCGEPAYLFGAAIGNASALRSFIDSTLSTSGTRWETEDYHGGTITSVEPNAAGALMYLAISRSYVLVSQSRTILAAAIDQDPEASLAANPALNEAMSRLPARPLAFMLSNIPEDITFGGAGIFQRSPIRWLAGSLSLGPESVKVDVTSDIDEDALPRAARALLSKPRNNVRSAGVAPAESLLFIGWDNVRAIWDQVVEAVWPDPDDYDLMRLQTIGAWGLDPEEDIFGWMTGELAIFQAPSAEELPYLGHNGIGIAIEARDAAVARNKLDKIMSSIGRSLDGAEITNEDVDGQTFRRIPLGLGDVSVYVGLVDGWILIGSSRSVAASELAGVRGSGGLESSQEYALARSALGDSLQFIGYVNVPGIVEISTSALGASAGDAEQVEAYTRPIRSVGLSVDTSAARIDATLFAHVVVPEELLGARSPGSASRSQSSFEYESVTVDASRDGGAWWDAPIGPADSRSYRPVEIPVGRLPFGQFLADALGARVTQAIGPDRRIGRRDETRGPFDDSLEDDVATLSNKLVVRVGSDGSYQESEIRAYREYVRCGGSLLLLSDGKRPGETDELAAAFGMRVVGIVAGNTAVEGFGSGDAPANGAPSIDFSGGTGLLSWEDGTLVQGLLASDGFVDLNGNLDRDADDPVGAPVAASLPYGRGRVAFIGTTSILDEPGHPLLERLFRFLQPNLRAPSPVASDAFEPDDSPERASTLTIDGAAQVHSLHASADVDWATVRMDAGSRVTVQVESECNVGLEWVASDGVSVLSDVTTFAYGGRADQATIRLEAGPTATHLIRAQPREQLGVCSSYTLSAQTAPLVQPDRNEPDDTAEQAREASSFARHTLHTAQDIDWVFLDARAAQSLEFETTSSECALTLALYAPDGRTTLAVPIQGSRGSRSASYTTPADGRYYARVASGADPVASCEAYSIRGQVIRPPEPVNPDAFEPDNSAAAAKPLAPGGVPQQRSIHVAGDEDWVSVRVDAPGTLRIATSGRCDTLLFLYRTDGRTLLADDDDGGDGTNAVIRYEIREPGAYYARVTLFSGDETCAAYELSGSFAASSTPGAAAPRPGSGAEIPAGFAVLGGRLRAELVGWLGSPTP